MRLQLNGQRAIRVDWLLTGPAHWASHFAFGLQLSPDLHLLTVHPFRKNERSLPQFAAVRMPRIKAAAHLHLSVETLHINSEHSRQPCDAIIGEGDDQLSRAVTLPLPDPGRTNTIT